VPPAGLETAVPPVPILRCDGQVVNNRLTDCSGPGHPVRGHRRVSVQGERPVLVAPAELAGLPALGPVESDAQDVGGEPRRVRSAAKDAPRGPPGVPVGWELPCVVPAWELPVLLVRGKCAVAHGPLAASRPAAVRGFGKVAFPAGFSDLAGRVAAAVVAGSDRSGVSDLAAVRDCSTAGFADNCAVRLCRWAELLHAAAEWPGVVPDAGRSAGSPAAAFRG